MDQGNEPRIWCSKNSKNVEVFRMRKLYDFASLNLEIRLKPVEKDRTNVFYKARWVVWLDWQNPEIIYDPSGLYDPVSSNKSFWILLAMDSVEGLIV